MTTMSSQSLAAAQRLGTGLMIFATLTGAVCAQDGDPKRSLSNDFPKSTTLVVGDPATQKALELSGLIKDLPFQIRWANMSGGPQTTEAFRAGALDVGSVADIPSIHAQWTGLPTKIVGVRFRKDPVATPKYQFGIAPGSNIKTLADLRGKRIAYSPGQAQGVIVLRVLEKAGLQRSDVKLVELPSTGDVYSVSLASRQVDVAPISTLAAKRYSIRYGRDGAIVIPHQVRDDAAFVYVRKAVVDDPAKAAALREYIKAWARAQQWVQDHPKEWAQGYYVKSQALKQDDADFLVHTEGEFLIPSDWTDVIAQQQDTIALMARENGKPVFDANILFDRRYERVATDALSSVATSTQAAER